GVHFMATTNMRGLTDFYAGFFAFSFDIAIFPYRKTFEFLAGKNPTEEDFIYAAIVTVALSTLFPVLDACFAFTCSVALALVGAAITSMSILYPLAFIADVLDQCCSTANDSAPPAYA
ncbi:MAG: hypothetical protein ACHP6H_07185, partial [Legionellales bacterium]